MNSFMNKFINLLKIVGIILALLLAALLVFISIDFVFKDILPSISRSVLSNFIIFASVIFLVYKIKVKKALDSAQKSVIDNIELSKETKLNSEKELQKIQQSVKNLSTEIDDILNKADNNADMVGAKILEDANKTAESIKDNSKNAVNTRTLLLKNDILQRASVASVEVAKSQIINELNNNIDLHMRLIDESIEAINEVTL